MSLSTFCARVNCKRPEVGQPLDLQYQPVQYALVANPLAHCFVEALPERVYRSTGSPVGTCSWPP